MYVYVAMCSLVMNLCLRDLFVLSLLFKRHSSKLVVCSTWFLYGYNINLLHVRTLQLYCATTVVTAFTVVNEKS